MKCVKCGGTGDAYDHDRDEWESPRVDCSTCKGSGETSEPRYAIRIDDDHPDFDHLDAS